MNTRNMTKAQRRDLRGIYTLVFSGVFVLAAFAGIMAWGASSGADAPEKAVTPVVTKNVKYVGACGYGSAMAMNKEGQLVMVPCK